MERSGEAGTGPLPHDLVGFPARNTDDRAMAILPELLHARLPELGIDYAFVYPTFGLAGLGIDATELRCASLRAFNRYYAASYAGLGDRLCPVAMIPMHTPEEATLELEHCVCELGFRAVLLAGHAARPAPIQDPPRIARWLDSFGLDSLYDYDPVWARCEELGVAPTFHSSAMGWPGRASPTNYVMNHLGNFAAAGEATCRSLFMGGVWGSDIGHWDVPDVREALPEAYAQVERGLLAEAEFRDFVFAHPVDLWTATNRDFFRGTAVGDAVAKEIAARP